MRKLRYMAALMVALCGLVACDKAEESGSPETTPVINARNIEGVWMLESLDGEKVDEDIYLYIEFVRDGQTFTTYDNFDTAYSHKNVGVFAFDKDDSAATYIDGYYTSNFNEEWGEHYFIRDFSLESMTWVGADSGSEQRFVAVDSVPADIVAGTRSI